MKISKAQKEQNRLTLIQAGVQLMNLEGVKDVTLRRIAHAAGMSEPVIYKYFPSKDDLLAAYFEVCVQQAFAQVLAQKDFAELTLPEQLHLYFDALLAQYEPNKKFVKEAYPALVLTGLASSLSAFAEQKRVFKAHLDTWFDAAVATQEFAAPPAKTLLVELLWDFQIGLIFYWLQDESEREMRTLTLLDKLIALLSAVLHSQVIHHFLEVVYFLVREHLLNSLDKVSILSQDQKASKTRFFQVRQNDKKTKTSRST